MERCMEPLVSILMPTYNHEKYIAQAIESAMSQKTDFAYELLIHDDCSTDGTLSIAKKYANQFPEKIKLLTEEKNVGLMRSYKALLEIACGKYVAILESDDFYVDEKKLQKQVDFLENNNDFGLVASDCFRVYEAEERTEKTHTDFDSRLNGEWYESLMRSNHLMAVTVMFRKSGFDLYCNINEYIEKKFLTFDYPVWLSIAANSKCLYIHEHLVAYRILGNAISNTTNYEKRIAFENSAKDIQDYICSKYGLKKMSKAMFEDSKVMRFIRTAVEFDSFSEYLKYSKFLHGHSLKCKVIRFFPRLWWLQHKMRGLK